MPADHELLTEALHALAAERGGHDSFDPGVFVERAHRTRRRRRALRGAGAAVFVGFTCLIVTLSAGRGVPDPPIKPAPSPTLTVTTRSDPLTLDMTFGWLPPTLDRLDYTIGAAPNAPALLQASTSDPDSPQSETDARAEPGNGDFVLSGATVPVPVDDINGSRPQAESGRDAEGRETILLRFRSPHGEVAALATHGLSLQDTLAIARSMVFARVVLPLQVRVSGVDAPAERAGVHYETIHGAWEYTQLDLAVESDPDYEVELVSYPQGRTPATDPWWDLSQGQNSSENLDGVHVIVGLSNSPVPDPVDPADLYPDAPATPHIPADPGAGRTNRSDYGDPSAFLRSHVSALGADPAGWTTAVLVP